MDGGINSRGSTLMEWCYIDFGSVLCHGVYVYTKEIACLNRQEEVALSLL